MRRIPLLALLGLTACILLSSALAQSGDPAEAAVRQALFASCGGVEAGSLPTGIQPGIYQGLLGTQPISLQLTASTAQQVSDHPELHHPDRYSYDRYGPDIVLERGWAANRTAGYALSAVEAVNDFGDVSARGCLDLSADGTGLKGQWRSPDDSKRLPVSLSRVDVAAFPLALPSSPGLLSLRKTDPFTFLRLNHAWTRVPGGLEEPLTGVSYPRVAGGPAALNAALQDKQLELAGYALDCRGGSGIGMNQKSQTDFSGAATLMFNRGGLVSLAESVDYYCGGAHPDNYTTGLTLDARTGREVKLVGTPGTLWPGLNARKVQALYLAAYGADGSDSECRALLSGEDGRSSEYPAFQMYLTTKGLALWPGFLPHVAGACAEVVTVSYATLRSLANPRSPYFRTLYSR
jgi:hypothetical protein